MADRRLRPVAEHRLVPVQPFRDRGLLCPGECQRGWVALAFGWVGVSRVEDLAWFANPLLIFGWLLAPSGARFLSGPFCVAALLISGAFLFATKVVGPGEGGFREADLVSIGSGYWLWLASIAMAVVAAMLFPRSKLQWP